MAAMVSVASSGDAGAVEGATAAGPIGGADIRSALPAPPGLYGGAVLGVVGSKRFVDGDGDTVPGLGHAKLTKAIGGAFVFYVPETTVFGGSLAFGGLLPLSHQCGKLFAGTDQTCKSGIGDIYVEANWSRFFGTWRPSKYPDAYPIPEGLSVMFGLGAVAPVGGYDARDPLTRTLSAGNNTGVIAPTVALTYTTPAWLAEGTEFSAKLFWQNHFKNPKTDYLAGDLIDVDFAVTERIGPFQAGFAGIYAVQTDDDQIAGVRIAPDGRRGEILQLGGVASYDMPARAMSMKVKATTTAYAKNAVSYWSLVTSWITKF